MYMHVCQPEPLPCTCAHCGRFLGVKVVPGIVLESDPPKAKGAKGQWRQMFHKDFNNAIALHRGAQTELREEKATYPWTLLAFLSGPGFVYFILNSGKVVKLALPQGAGVIFRGDVHHAGAAYDAWNLRAHWYLIPETSPNKGHYGSCPLAQQ